MRSEKIENRTVVMRMTAPRKAMANILIYLKHCVIAGVVFFLFFICAVFWPKH